MPDPTTTYPTGSQDDLRPLGRARYAGRRRRNPDVVVEALNRVRGLRRATRPTTEVGYCLRETRELFDIGPSAPDAITAWNRATTKHHVGDHDMTNIPSGSFVFWRIGKHGHIAPSAGQHPYVFSTDILRPGYFDRVRIEDVHERWGAVLLGYTRDLNGVRL